MSVKIPTLMTPHLSLRPLETADAITLHRIYQVEDVLRYFPNTTPPPFEKVEKFIAGQEKHWAEYGYGNWGIIPTDENDIIGWVGLQYVPELLETEVGYLLARPFWGRGYATEAATAVRDYAFYMLQLPQLISLIRVGNLASKRVAEKVGMTLAEEITRYDTQYWKYSLNNKNA